VKTLSLSVDRADARIGRPLTPGSVAGVNRRVRRQGLCKMPEPYSFGIKIVKDAGRLAVFIKGRRVKATPAAAAVLA
jgi:hypothetical protein